MAKPSKNLFLNIGGLGSMNKIKHFFETSRILVVLGIITVIGSIFVFCDEEGLVSRVYGALDTGSAVALALLAFYAYYQYSRDKQNTKRFLEQLEKIDSLNNKDAFVGIQFGGGNKDAYIEMQQFAKSKNIDDKLVLIKRFGDEANLVSKNDIAELEKYLKNEVMPMLSGADKIHLTVAGVGVAFYVCADIFSNWKPIIIYNRNKAGKYEKWYTDNKHREKIESNLHKVAQ